MKLISLMPLFIIITGCAAGVIKQPYMDTMTESNSSNLCIVRTFGEGPRYNITMEGWPVAKFYPSQYLCFKIPSGQHSIGIENQSNITLDFTTGGTTYFKTNNYGSAITLERLTKEKYESIISERISPRKLAYTDITDQIIEK